MKRDTRKLLLEKGFEFFLNQGFNNAGIAQVLKEADVPKGSFYHYFPSKEEFGIQVLDYYFENAMQKMRGVLENPEMEPLQRIRTFFQQTIACAQQDQTGRGCLMGNLTQEMGGLCPKFSEKLEEKWHQLEVLIANNISQAMAQGQMGSTSRPVDLAHVILNSWQGALMRSKITGNTTPLEKFVTLAFDRLLV